MGDVVLSDDMRLNKEDPEVIRSMMKLAVNSTVPDFLNSASKVLSNMSPAPTIACLHILARDHTSGSFPKECLGALDAMLHNLQKTLPQVKQPRCLARLVWSLGKLEHLSPSSEACMLYVASTPEAKLSNFSSQDLSNMLWGFARLYASGKGSRSGGKSHDQIVRFATTILELCNHSIDSFSSQCF